MCGNIKSSCVFVRGKGLCCRAFLICVECKIQMKGGNKMKLPFNMGNKISFGDRVTGDPKLFSTCLNCKFYIEKYGKKICGISGEEKQNNDRCTSHKQR